MNLTQNDLQLIFPLTKAEVIEKFIDPLNKTFHEYKIDSVPRIAMFLAQVGHESGGFNFVEENLNYRGERLVEVFPKYFKGVDVSQYARNPEKIANRVYANRMGNGTEASGDGYRYRGRGLIQLTGKSNYSRFAEAVGMSLDDVVSYLETPEGAAVSAGWFWHTNNLNSFSDAGDIVGATKRINGGVNGLAHRQDLYNQAIKILA